MWRGREGSRGFSVTTLILIRAAFLFADPFFFLLYLIPGKKTGKGEKATGGGGAERMLLVSYGVDPTGRSQEGEVSIYATWLLFMFFQMNVLGFILFY